MALQINSQCINCDMCLPECPNDAIIIGATQYEILVDRCTHCVGFYSKPTCVEVCPINCIDTPAELAESEEELKIKFHKLYPNLIASDQA